MNTTDATSDLRQLSPDLTGAQILIVDDAPANIRLLRNALESQEYRIIAARDGKRALQIAGELRPDLLLLDIMMPGMDGYEVCRRLKQDPATADIPVIFVTIREEKDFLVKAFGVGCVDYVTKPFEKEEVLLRVETHLKMSRLTQTLARQNSELVSANEVLRQEVARREQAEDALQRADEQLSLLSEHEAQRWGIEGFIGKSSTIADVLTSVRRLQTTDSTSVLITGESGTGKELIARAIHFGGPRTSGPFIPVNCSTIPHELAESLLFGHVTGAFTGARSRKGYFELADGGTLFLDEVGDMPLELQPKFLRVLDRSGILPVGGTQERVVDVRIVAATNQDLRARMEQGSFREDLYFRLARAIVRVPPLRERPEDIPLLAEHFLSLFAAEMNIPKHGPLTLSEDVAAILKAYPFPGNVRELKNTVERALIQSGGARIEPRHLDLFFLSQTIPTTPTPVVFASREQQRSLAIKQALTVAQGDTARAAQILGTSPVAVYRCLQELGEDDAFLPAPTDEERIRRYIDKVGDVNNAECCELLGVDHQRASYLLKKMHREGILRREGERRWARYCLP